MKLKLADMKNDCQQFNKYLSETELMMSVITDLKTVKKLGFFGDNIENGVQHLTKPIDNLNFNLTSKMSPKNLRSKIEKVTSGTKKPKRAPKTDKDLITTKIAQGKKLSIIEIASLDPDKIARDRAEREYERFDDKLYYQTPQKYNGNPTYAILEIENRLKSKQSGCVVVNDDTNKEVIKGYTKQMMDVLRKQQLIVEQQMSPITHKKRSREGLRNVIKQTRKSMSYRNGMIEKKECKKNRIILSPALTPRLKRGRPKRTRLVETVQLEEDELVSDNEIVVKEQIIVESPTLKNKRKRGRPSRHIQKLNASIVVVQNSEEEEVVQESEEEEVVAESEAEEELALESEVEECVNESDEEDEEIVAPDSDVESEVESEVEPEEIPEPPKRARGRPKRIVKAKSVRKEEESAVNEEVASINGETSDQESAVSSNLLGPHRLRKKPKTLRYYRDNDFVLSTDDSSHSSASNATSMKRARGKTQANTDVGILTRNKIKSRSSSRSHPDIQEVEEEEEEEDEEDDDDESVVADDDVNDDESECINESAQGSEDGDQEETFYESEMEESEDEKSVSESESNDDENSSVDIKYSPIKTRHARTHNDEANRKLTKTT